MSTRNKKKLRRSAPIRRHISHKEWDPSDTGENETSSVLRRSDEGEDGEGWLTAGEFNSSHAQSGKVVRYRDSNDDDGDEDQVGGSEENLRRKRKKKSNQ